MHHLWSKIKRILNEKKDSNQFFKWWGRKSNKCGGLTHWIVHKDKRSNTKANIQHATYIKFRQEGPKETKSALLFLYSLQLFINIHIMDISVVIVVLLILHLTDPKIVCAGCKGSCESDYNGLWNSGQGSSSGIPSSTCKYTY